MNVAELLVACLEREGVTHVFALPGEENADVMFALEASDIEVVMTRHEQGAGFMAEVYGRLKGTPAVALATLGPGASNLLTPIADANMDHAPLVAITGQGSTRRLHKESHQIIDVERMFEPVTKWSHSIRHVASVPEVMRKAIRLARSEKPGAVVVELPEDLAALDTDAKPLEPLRFKRPTATAETIDSFVARLQSAERPLIIAGNGAVRTRASRALRDFVAQTGIGVVSTFMGKGAVDCELSECLFSIGLSQRDYIVEAIEDADLIICVGYDLVEYPPARWNPGCSTDVVHIDFDPAEIDEDYQPCLELVGDIAETFETVVGEMAKLDFPRHQIASQLAVRKRMLDELAAEKDDASEGALKPQKVLWDIRAALAPNDILISGVGAHKMWVARYYHCREPNTCLIPNGYCSMGGALPGAIGAKLAKPNNRVVVVAGDGDFLMNVQEMETAQRLGSDITVIVWVDDAYGLIAWKQEDEFGRHTPLGFGNPDWASLAKSFGWWHAHVTKSVNLKSTLESALAFQGPSLLTLPIDYRENAKLSERLGRLEVRG